MGSLKIWKTKGYLRSQFSEVLAPHVVLWQKKRRKTRVERCLCFDLKHCVHPTSGYLFLKGKARSGYGLCRPVNFPPPPRLWKTAKWLPSSPGTCGVLLRKVNGTAIIQLPSKRQMQVCVSIGGRDQQRRNYRNAPFLSGIVPRCFRNHPELGVSFSAM